MPAYKKPTPKVFTGRAVISNPQRFATPKRPLKSSRSYPTLPLGLPYTKGNLVSIDPGWSSGMAFRTNGQLSTCVVFRPMDVLDLIELANQVVIERFQTAGRISAAGLDTVTLVGMVIGYCTAKNIPLEIAQPTDRWTHQGTAESMCGPNKLITPSKVSRHECDALAHLLAYEYRQSK